MADTGGPAHESGLDARVGRLESDVGEIRSILNRLAPRIDEMYGFLTARLPELATKAELIDLRAETKTQIADLRAETKTQIADLRAETKTEFADVRQEMAGLRLEIMQRPTRRQSIFDIFTIVGLIGPVLSIAARFAH
jgi:ribosomal protein L29